MKTPLSFLLLLLVATISATSGNHSVQLQPDTDAAGISSSSLSTSCIQTILSTVSLPPKASTYSNLAYDVTRILAKVYSASSKKNISREAAFAKKIFSENSNIVAIAISSPLYPYMLAYRNGDRLLIHTNRTRDTDIIWKALEIPKNKSNSGWTPPFRDCHLSKGKWFYGYLSPHYKGLSVGFFIPVYLNQCDDKLEEIFGGKHKCDEETTVCKPKPEYGLKRGGYFCVCKYRFYFPGGNSTWKGFPGEDVEGGYLTPRCIACPSKCDRCDSQGSCMPDPNFFLRMAILAVQLTCMTVTIVIAFVVFRQRKCKTIASGMWTVLETVLLGIFLLYSTIIIRFFEPSIERCLLEPWAREIGFIICYGSIVLKLYRHLIDFRTRKAHRWVVKDTDLLKYLFVMILSVFAYMAAFTATSLNFIQENYSLLSENGLHFITCKPLWWDYVTEIGEMLILVFGVHLSFGTRNAATQFQERRFLCAAISVELAVSGVFYIIRAVYIPHLHPDHEFLAYFLRSQLTNSTALVLVFTPKLWYQHKQARSLAQEFSCRLPVDAFKPDAANTHGPLMSNNSDVDVGEISIADMSPDDIRAELKRLYTQLEILKNKTLRLDNPHISKRRGGRKVAHRRFSLQKKGSREKALHHKHHKQHKHVHEAEVTEGEVSRTPEDSVCSGEGPSAIYNDLVSTYSELVGTPNAASIKPQPSSYSQPCGEMKTVNYFV